MFFSKSPKIKKCLSLWFFLLYSSFLFSQHDSKPIPDSGNSGNVQFIVLQINDFYEISPLENGSVGGAARIATLRKKLLQENPNVLTVLAGDFLSPTLLGTLKFEGQRIQGRQMIEVLNKTGIDLVTFGNHEFDLNEKSLQNRINESSFDWVSSNVVHLVNNVKEPFYKQSDSLKIDIPKHRIIPFKNNLSQEIKIGIVAPCLASNRVAYVHYDDIYESVKTELNLIKNKTNFIISLSHLNKEDDLEMAKMFPEINLILGGHEHDNMKYEIGKTIMTKADANARTAYVHRVSYNIQNKKYNIQSSLVKLDQSIVLDPEVSLIVEKWKAIENKLMREMGFDPDEVLTYLDVAYDARELIIRNKASAFCEMICRAMTKGTSQTHCSILNSGSIRVDDVLKDKLSQYDILRSLPYGGSIIEMDIRGRLLKKILDAGIKNVGTGGFLQWDKVARGNDGNWFISGELLDEQKVYHVCITEYLLTGLETGLDFLNKFNSDIEIVYPPRTDDPKDLRNDIRKIVIDYLKNGGK